MGIWNVWPLRTLVGAGWSVRRLAVVALALTFLTQTACSFAGLPATSRPTATPDLCGGLAAGASAHTESVTTAATPRAPLTYGVNLSMYDTQDSVVNDTNIQAKLRDAGVPIIRMPFRSTLSDEYDLQAMRAVRAMNALPVLIMHGPTDPNMLADDFHLLTLAISIFHQQTVYIEFSNEPELAGVSAKAYAEAWNRVIPCLKSIAPTYKFIGPANAFYNPEYLASFVRLASPRPDYISWHEYACANSDSDNACLSYIGHWTEHMTGMNKAVKSAIGKAIPIMITEWNLDDRPDPRYQQTAFIQQWTTEALATLAANRANGLYAAMQYCVTNNPNFSLVNQSGSYTPAGQAFFTALRQARAAAS